MPGPHSVEVLMLHQDTRNLTEQSIYPWIPGKTLGDSVPFWASRCFPVMTGK